jgi:hypothetical protein
MEKMKTKLLIAALFLAACGGGCPIEKTQCNGSTVEICNSDERWEDVMDCADFEPGNWVCVEAGETATCEVE